MAIIGQHLIIQLHIGEINLTEVFFPVSSRSHLEYLVQFYPHAALQEGESDDLASHILSSPKKAPGL